MINKKLLETIEKDLQETLKELGEKHGVEIRFGSGTYTAVDATLKLKVTSKVKNSDEYLKQEWDEYCRIYGFKPEHFGATAIHKGEEMRLIGFNNGKPKNCISFIRISDGAKYMCSREAGHSIFKISDEKGEIN